MLRVRRLTHAHDRSTHEDPFEDVIEDELVEVESCDVEEVVVTGAFLSADRKADGEDE